MRRLLFVLSLLSLATLPVAARADQIYDFRVFGTYGDGTPFPTLTYSADASGVAYQGRYNLTYVPIFDVNGSNNMTVFQTFDYGPSFAYFFGNDLFAFDYRYLTFSGDLSGTNPVYTFHPGTYYAQPSYPVQSLLTLTVTPETSPVPEPNALILVGTGLASCFAFSYRKALRRIAAPQSS